MTSPRLLLAAGSIAATLAGIVPVLSAGAPAAAQPVRVDAAGVAVSVARLAAGQGYEAKLVVPEGVTTLSGASSGSPALAARVRVVLTRSTDRAVLFTGSLATFHSLRVVPGTALALHVQKPAGFAGLRADARLRFS